MLTIELGRVERPDEPYAFDGKPQKYFARGAQAKLGVAVLRWDEVEKDALCQKKLPIDKAFQKAHEALSASSLDWASLQFFEPSPVRARGQRIVFSPDEPLPELPEELAVAYEVNFNVAPASTVEALEGRAGGTRTSSCCNPSAR